MITHWTTPELGNRVWPDRKHGKMMMSLEIKVKVGKTFIGEIDRLLMGVEWPMVSG